MLTGKLHPQLQLPPVKCFSCLCSKCLDMWRSLAQCFKCGLNLATARNCKGHPQLGPKLGAMKRYYGGFWVLAIFEMAHGASKEVAFGQATREREKALAIIPPLRSGHGF